MIPAAAIGVGFGVGLWALVVWAIPPRPRLGTILRRPDAIPTPRITGHDDQPTGWPARLRRACAGRLARLGLPTRATATALAVTGRAVPVHLATQAAGGITGLLAPPTAMVLLAAAGVPVPWQAPVLVSVVGGVLGFLLPDLRVRRDATRRREDFRIALSAYLNLVRITLAAGSGVEGALSDAAVIGHGWPFTQLRRALTVAAATRSTPWAALRELATELDITELAELSASLGLAGSEGAKVRASLRAKATALRTRQLADTEAHAHTATERMSLPVILLFLGFLLFIGYPALTQVLAGI